MITRGSFFRVSVVVAIAIGIAINFEHSHEDVTAVSDAADRPRMPIEMPVSAVPVTKPKSKKVAETDDPFSPRGWQSPPPLPPLAPVVAPPVVVAPAAPAPVEAPVAPSLPYAFMGQFDDGGRQLVYLSRDDQTFVITPGEILEGSYKVLAMSPRQIEFEHIPTGTKQVLAIPAPNN